MHKINLLYIITKLELGGAQKHLLSLISGLDKVKYNIFLFTAQDGLLINDAKALKELTLKRSRFLERPVNIFKDILALGEIYNFIKANKIQIVHTHSSKAGILGRLAAKMAKVSVIIHTVHGWSFHDYQFRFIRFVYLLLERICAVFSNKIIVVSDYDKEKGLKNLIGKTKQYIVINYGLEQDVFNLKVKHNGVRLALGVSNTDLLIGMVACFKAQKAPLDFIRIAKEVSKNIPAVKFIMVGDGKLHNKICALIKDFNLEHDFILTGWRQDVLKIIAELDIFVLTSLWEGLPIAVLEAMALGVPVVATDTGGISQLIEDGRTGYLVKPGDKLIIQNRVEELLRDKPKRSEFARLARERIVSGKFQLGKMINETEKIYSGFEGEL